MNNPIAKWVASLGPLGLSARCALLTLAVLLVLVVAGWYAHAVHGTAGLLAAGVAALLCWVGSTAALLLTGLAGPQAAMTTALGGMFFRMGLPLLGGMLLHLRVPALADAGVFGLIVVFYLITLVVEVSLSLPLVRRDKDLSSVL